MENRLLRVTMIVLMILLCSAIPVSAGVSNVAFGATVELVGAPFFSGGWGGGFCEDES